MVSTGAEEAQAGARSAMVARAVTYGGCMMKLAWLEGRGVDSSLARSMRRWYLQLFGVVMRL